MKTYIINHLDKNNFDAIITLLDYQTNISRCLETIHLSPGKTRNVLIDTVLCSGMNEYRFIETDLNEDGTINLDHCHYVSVDDNVLNTANEILNHHPASLKNSVLPMSQIQKIIGD